MTDISLRLSDPISDISETIDYRGFKISTEGGGISRITKVEKDGEKLYQTNGYDMESAKNWVDEYIAKEGKPGNGSDGNSGGGSKVPPTKFENLKSELKVLVNANEKIDKLLAQLRSKYERQIDELRQIERKNGVPTPSPGVPKRPPRKVLPGPGRTKPEPADFVSARGVSNISIAKRRAKRAKNLFESVMEEKPSLNDKQLRDRFGKVYKLSDMADKEAEKAVEGDISRKDERIADKVHSISNAIQDRIMREMDSIGVDLRSFVNKHGVSGLGMDAIGDFTYKGYDVKFEGGGVSRQTVVEKDGQTITTFRGAQPDKARSKIDELAGKEPEPPKEEDDRDDFVVPDNINQMMRMVDTLKQRHKKLVGKLSSFKKLVKQMDGVLNELRNGDGIHPGPPKLPPREHPKVPSPRPPQKPTPPEPPREGSVFRGQPSKASKKKAVDVVSEAASKVSEAASNLLGGVGDIGIGDDGETRYDLNMDILDKSPEARKKALKERFSGIDANKQAQYMAELVTELEEGIQRNREMVRKIFVELQSHPDYYKSEVDAMKGQLEILKDKEERLTKRLGAYQGKVDKNESYLDYIKRTEGHSPMKTNRVEALKKEIQKGKQKVDELKTRLSDIKSRINTLENKIR